MWSSVRSFLLSLVVARSVVAELSFIATARQGNTVVKISDSDFVPTVPRRHRNHGPPSNTTVSTNTTMSRRSDPVSYSGNWCGASQHSTSADQITNIFGYFTVPDLTLRKGIAAPQFAAAWLGIDGASCRKSLLQAGVTTVVNSNGGQSASAWWEWYPEASYTIKGLPVKPGEWVSVNVTASSTTAGKIIITNVNQGYSMSINITNGPALCRTDAEWVVEDFYDADGQVAFASFSDIWFEETVATTVRKNKLTLKNATMVALKNDTGVVTCMSERYDDTNFVAWAV
ncbi:peptidase A4 family-domain-containing protein [Podospora appendiculata]|uniref:Peptidase A4 family-domain-containing protein n=1 Tax=Podospora appendiculata TaxID=314037 RepID=A0AAE0XJA4_9PEZI|nr:peptidase A4 family-domain-containing protein [Podospora appendiculata]